MKVKSQAAYSRSNTLYFSVVPIEYVGQISNPEAVAFISDLMTNDN